MRVLLRDVSGRRIHRPSSRSPDGTHLCFSIFAFGLDIHPCSSLIHSRGSSLVGPHADSVAIQLAVTVGFFQGPGGGSAC